jgi:Tol biopolymer transport system component
MHAHGATDGETVSGFAQRLLARPAPERYGRGVRRALVLIVSCLVVLGGATSAHATFPGRDGRIAFAHLTAGGTVEIMTVAPRGGSRALLTHRSISRDPAWSSDGSLIAFARSDGGRPHHLWVMRADGSDERQVDARHLEAWPAWSPDGRRIAVVSQGVGFNYRIATIRPDGTGWRRLTRRGSASDPDWSPDGTTIAFDVGGQIATMGPLGHRMHVVTTDGGSEPSWSPSGRRIAFTHDGELWTIRPDGTGLMQLTSTGIAEASPSWSPSGRRIADLRTRSNEERDRYLAALWTIRRDGTGPRRVLRRVAYGQFPLESPAWQPIP